MMLFRLASLFLFGSFLFAQPSAYGSPKDADLGSKLRTIVHDYRLEAVSLVDALTKVAGRFEIPMGIEWVETKAAGAGLTRSWARATVREIIQEVAHAYGYQMATQNDIVHVYASNLVPEQQNFLRLKVKHFAVDDVPFVLASRKLRELVRFMVTPSRKSGGVESKGVAGSLIGNVSDPLVSLELTNASVRDALDALAVVSTRKIWVVTFQPEPTLTPTGLRRTRTLWNDHPIPDDEQPLWDLLHWGETVPVGTKSKPQ